MALGPLLAQVAAYLALYIGRGHLIIIVIDNNNSNCDKGKIGKDNVIKVVEIRKVDDVTQKLHSVYVTTTGDVIDFSSCLSQLFPCQVILGCSRCKTKFSKEFKWFPFSL